MKTRIISGAAITLISAGVLGLQLIFPPLLQIAFALLGIVAVIEAVYSTGIAKNKLLTTVGAVLAAMVPFVMAGYIALPLSLIFTVFATLQFALYLGVHKSIKLEGMLGAVLLPIVISFGFSSFCQLAQMPNSKLFYVVIALCWSYISDTGAYFTGVLLGKHKMAPIISPKKTWEGFCGGMAFSLLFVLGVWAIYSKLLGINVLLLNTLLITPLFVSVGVLGDLTASLIKRKCGIKDFGSLIPGHGGIMDRFDSNLMIAPLFYQFVLLFPLIG